MNSGLVSLLGLLQVGSLQDTSLQSSIKGLMDSVGPVVNSVEIVTPMNLIYTQGSLETDLAACKILTRGDGQGGSVAVGMCRKMLEPEQNRPAIMVSSRHDSLGVPRETIIIDWDNDYHVDVCYNNSLDAGSGRVNVRFLNPRDCQLLYHRFLSEFESYRKSNGS